MTRVKYHIIFFLFLCGSCSKGKTQFVIADGKTGVQIVYDQNSSPLDSIAAYLLAHDISLVSDCKPEVVTNQTRISGPVIIIGSISSPLVRKLVDVNPLQNKWESYSYTFLNEWGDSKNKALVIAGSDPRGTAYGVFSLSETIGVSPWYWWADVPVKKRDVISIPRANKVSHSPSVKYRGVFLNDEDWGLQPWAAKTLEPETGDIGPKTYARIFELLLRLKANLIWPAMHPSTRAFFHYPGNVEMARKWNIIVGSSHAEPMLRNNVDEWDHETYGDFNYVDNKVKVYKYWEDRVKESKGLDAIYTVGMRGVHDSGMKGVNSRQEAVALTEKIIADQRQMLQQYIHDDVDNIPQSFTAYKEVLDIYDNGLRLPEDITIVWPDDNYGYLRRLNNEEENKRSGGSGVYYHASYWGRPHDYLWLSTTHPALIKEEITKAYQTGSKKLWVLNVGDLKPLEYNISLFMDMAYDVDPFLNESTAQSHLEAWLSKNFGIVSDSIADVLWTYYDLAFERRPEFMGWSQTEPTTQIHNTAYNHFAYGDEAQARIDRYENLKRRVKNLQSKISAENRDAFYELVYYPVVCAAEMNKKFLFLEKAKIYSRQQRLSAKHYADSARQAYDAIVKETTYYNERLAGGKWNNIMSMKPRNLPVFQEPTFEEISEGQRKTAGVAGVVSEGDSTELDGGRSLQLPGFSAFGRQQHFIDIFLKKEEAVEWYAKPSAPWIEISEESGRLAPEAGKYEKRLWVSINWEDVPSDVANGAVDLTLGNEEMKISIEAFEAKLGGFKGFVEANGYISMYAEDFQRIDNKKNAEWKFVEGLGHSGEAMMAQPWSMKVDTTFANSACLEYDFYIFSDKKPSVHLFALPVHPVNDGYEQRIGVSIDNGPVSIVNFRTRGRSEEWKQNVLSNQATRSIDFSGMASGKHTLKVYTLDPGFILDRIEMDLGGLKSHYGVLPETKRKQER